MSEEHKRRLMMFIKRQIEELRLQKEREKSREELTSKRARWFNKEINKLEGELKSLGDE
jgi:ABC-type phosphate transport system auxiliary subunit